MPDADLKTLVSRAHCLRATRQFFWDRGFLEIDTPLLSPALIPESTIEIFTAEYHSHSGRPRTMWLIPSPEIWMKRLLALGSGDIFQISKCFRDREPPTGAHHPEFSMLEWYAVGKNYLDTLLLQEEYFDAVRVALGVGKKVSVGGRSADLGPPFIRLTMRQAFQDALKLNLDELLEIEALAERSAAFGIARTPGDTWESLFHKLFLQEIEPCLPRDRPFFLLDYPAMLPTLARSSPDGRYAERWELFVGGLEIANCYTEERDRTKIMRFFNGESVKKKTSSAPPAVDWELAEILANGLPVCSGNALGLDRLLMVLLQKNTIREVLPFAWATGPAVDYLTVDPRLI